MKNIHKAGLLLLITFFLVVSCYKGDRIMPSGPITPPQNNNTNNNNNTTKTTPKVSPIKIQSFNAYIFNKVDLNDNYYYSSAEIDIVSSFDKPGNIRYKIYASSILDSAASGYLIMSSNFFDLPDSLVLRIKCPIISDTLLKHLSLSSYPNCIFSILFEDEKGNAIVNTNSSPHGFNMLTSLRQPYRFKNILLDFL
jgi:hypothetical protein